MQQNPAPEHQSDEEKQSLQPHFSDIPFVAANPLGRIQTREHRLPHWQQGEAAQFVTWRLGDSLPREKLEIWREEKSAWLKKNPKPWDDSTENNYYRQFDNRMEEWLDAGSGSCLLAEKDCRQIVEKALLYFDGERYILWAFVIMPNHVHTLVSLCASHRLEETLHSWKSYTAKKINRHMGQTGPLWQEDYWDRLIRNKVHFDRCVEYIRGNPVKARLSADQYAHYENGAIISHYTEERSKARE